MGCVSGQACNNRQHEMWPSSACQNQGEVKPSLLLLQVTGVTFIDKGSRVLVATQHGVEVRRVCKQREFLHALVVLMLLMVLCLLVPVKLLCVDGTRRRHVHSRVPAFGPPMFPCASAASAAAAAAVCVRCVLGPALSC